MILVLTWILLMLWHWHMARRRAKKKSVPDWERELGQRANRWVRIGLLWGLALWVFAWAVHVRATATMDAASYAMSECKWWLYGQGEALQACVAPAQAVYVESAATAAASEAVMWVLGVL